MHKIEYLKNKKNFLNDTKPDFWNFLSESELITESRGCWALQSDEGG